MSCDNCGHIGDYVRIIIIKNKWPHRTHVLSKFCSVTCLFKYCQKEKK